MSKLDAKIPEGSIDKKWTNHKNKINIVAPANKRQIDVIVVGTGLAVSAAFYRDGTQKHFVSRTLQEEHIPLLLRVGSMQQNYQNDGDSTYRLFTIL